MRGSQGVLLVMIGALILWLIWSGRSPFVSNASGGSKGPPTGDSGNSKEGTKPSGTVPPSGNSTTGNAIAGLCPVQEVQHFAGDVIHLLTGTYDPTGGIGGGPVCRYYDPYEDNAPHGQIDVNGKVIVE